MGQLVGQEKVRSDGLVLALHGRQEHEDERDDEDDDPDRERDDLDGEAAGASHRSTSLEFIQRNSG